MPRPYSHEGFWAVVRAARRLNAAGWWHLGIDLSVRRPLRMAGLPWRLLHAIYANESSRRRMKYLFLLPPSSLTRNGWARWRDGEAAALITKKMLALGYSRRRPNRQDHNVVFEMRAQAGAVQVEWDEILRLLTTDDAKARRREGKRASTGFIGTILDEVPGLIRNGWMVYHLDVRGPFRHFRAQGHRWVAKPYLYWFAREGISLGVLFSSMNRVSRTGFRSLEPAGFFKGLARGLRRLGLTRCGGPWFHSGSSVTFDVDVHRLPPRRVEPLIRRLQGWNPLDGLRDSKNLVKNPGRS